jgi:Phosphotransferase enzyme family
MPPLVDLIAAVDWEPVLERTIFGTEDPHVVAQALEAFVARHCAPVEEAVFYRPGVGVVAGLRLSDGTEVVVKVHRWNVSLPRLRAIATVQARVAACGLPAPHPIAGPEGLAGGIAMIEELQRGSRADGRRPEVRQALARGLHDFVTAALPLAGVADVGPPLMLRPPGEPLWFEPHDVRFDFEATSAGSEWIDELAERARSRLDQVTAPDVIGHFDWRIENLTFDSTAIAGIFDWDSVAAAPESVVVGNTAGQFTADWSTGGAHPLPTPVEMCAFVNDYEVARGVPFGPDEREAADAANLFLCAYGARCEHSDRTFHPEIGQSHGGSSWMRLLRERGEQLFTRSS